MCAMYNRKGRLGDHVGSGSLNVLVGGGLIHTLENEWLLEVEVRGY